MCHKGKEYTYKKVGDKIKYYIDGKDGSEYKGQSFYKYYPLNDYSVDALTHLYIYASHPNQLNDPFDCADGLIRFDDLKSAQLFANKFYPAIEELCEKDENTILDFVKSAYRTYLYTELGILCLSKTWDDVSMWSAYTDHKGFVPSSMYLVSHLTFGDLLRLTTKMSWRVKVLNN